MNPRTTDDLGARSTRPGISALLLGVFFTSGAVGLVYELLWTRMIAAWFGASAHAIATTLAAFMVGLALGSWAASRWLTRPGRRPLAAYAVVETGIALYAVALLLVSKLAQPQLLELARLLPPGSALGLMIRFVVLGAALLPATALMGATFPLLTQALGDRGAAPARAIGLAYGANVLGAAAGCALTGLWLLNRVGTSHSILLAAGLNLVVAGVALGLRRASPLRSSAAAPARPPQPQLGGHADRALLLLVGLSSLAVMANEVLWSRLYRQALGLTSPYEAFALVLSVVLLGMGLGSLVVERVGQRWSPARLLLAFGLLQLILAAAALLATAQVRWFLVAAFEPLATRIAARRLLSILVLLASAASAGAAWPVLATAYARSAEGLGARVGRFYAVSTAAGVLGSLLGGFVILPWLGLRVGVLAIGALHATCALLAGWGPRRWAMATAAGVSLVALGATARLGSDRPEFHLPGQVVFIEDGVEATTVVELPGREDRSPRLFVNGMAIESHPLPERVLLPLAVAPNRADVLLVGFGTGRSAADLLRALPDVTLDCVELDDNQASTSTWFDTAWVLEDPRFTLYTGDGRHHLLTHRRQYDLVIIDAWGQTVNPELYSTGMFTVALRALRRDGIVFAKLPISSLGAEEDLHVLTRTAAEAFPQAWLMDTTGMSGLVGARAGTALAERPMTMPPRGKRPGRDQPWTLAPIGSAMLASLGEGPINTDDHPWRFTSRRPRFSLVPSAEDSEALQQQLELRLTTLLGSSDPHTPGEPLGPVTR